MRGLRLPMQRNTYFVGKMFENITRSCLLISVMRDDISLHTGHEMIRVRRQFCLQPR